MKANKVLLYAFSCLFVICGLTETINAKSVFAIIKHAKPSILKAYDINGNQLEEYPNGSGIIDVSDILPDEGYGAVSVCFLRV